MTLAELDCFRNTSTRGVKLFRRVRDRHAEHATRNPGGVECPIVTQARLRMTIRRGMADAAVMIWINQGCKDT